jgi:hypothetical protein
MGYGLNDRGFESLQELGIFLFTTASRPAPIQSIQGALSLWVKRPGREDDHSPPTSAEVKECMELYLHFPNTPLWRATQLMHRDNFTFCLTDIFDEGVQNGEESLHAPQHKHHKTVHNLWAASVLLREKCA